MPPSGRGQRFSAGAQACQPAYERPRRLRYPPSRRRGRALTDARPCRRATLANTKCTPARRLDRIVRSIADCDRALKEAGSETRKRAVRRATCYLLHLTWTSPADAPYGAKAQLVGAYHARLHHDHSDPVRERLARALPPDTPNHFFSRSLRKSGLRGSTPNLTSRPQANSPSDKDQLCQACCSPPRLAPQRDQREVPRDFERDIDGCQ